MTVHMQDYKIAIEGSPSIREVKAALITMIRGLWGTNYSHLKSNVLSLSQELQSASELTDDQVSRFNQLVSNFNGLSTDTLNRQLLDNNKLPMSDPPAPTPSPTDPTLPGEDKMASMITQAVAAGVSPVISVLPKDDANKLAPVASQASVSRLNDQIVEHEARLTKLEKKNDPIDWKRALIGMAIVGLIFYIITGAIFGWTAMIIPALSVMFFACFIIVILPPFKSGATDQPRG